MVFAAGKQANSTDLFLYISSIDIYGAVHVHCNEIKFTSVH